VINQPDGTPFGQSAIGRTGEVPAHPDVMGFRLSWGFPPKGGSYRFSVMGFRLQAEEIC
jgi:hypothetical protein